MSPASDAAPKWRPEGGVLYVVATPIGNLGDLSPRAEAILRDVDCIAAEDTRSLRALPGAGDSRAQVISLHEHNESQRVAQLLERLRAGASVALVSEAGTPLISDPGYALVRAVREAGFPVLAVPGPCAAIAALSVSGIATDRFVFEGFLPPRRSARRARLAELRAEPRTMVFYESPHRIEAALADLLWAFGPERRACIARELSKRFEQSHADRLAALVQWLGADPQRRRGEFVLVVEGAPQRQADEAEALRIARLLAEELGPSAAARLASRITGVPRRRLYEALG